MSSNNARAASQTRVMPWHAEAERLFDEGYQLSEIARMIGKSDSVVRLLLDGLNDFDDRDRLVAANDRFLKDLHAEASRSQA